MLNCTTFTLKIFVCFVGFTVYQPSLCYLIPKTDFLKGFNQLMISKQF